MTYRELPGLFCDAIPGGLVRVLPDAQTVVCERHGVELWRVHAPDIVRDVKASRAPNGTVWAVAQTGSTYNDAGELDPHGKNRLMLIDAQGVTITRHLCVAVDGAAISHDGQNFVVLTQISPTSAKRIAYVNRFETVATIGVPPELAEGTAFGFLRFKAGRSYNGTDDEVVWTDEQRSVVVEGMTWRFPQPIDQGLIGQYGDGDWIGAVREFDDLSIALSTLIAEQAFAPRVAEEGGRYIICAPLLHGRIGVADVPPWPEWFGEPVDPEPPDPEPPDPEPPDPEPPDPPLPQPPEGVPPMPPLLEGDAYDEYRRVLGLKLQQRFNLPPDRYANTGLTEGEQKAHEMLDIYRTFGVDPTPVEVLDSYEDLRAGMDRETIAVLAEYAVRLRR